MVFFFELDTRFLGKSLGGARGPYFWLALGFFVVIYVLDEALNYSLSPAPRWLIITFAGPLVALVLSIRRRVMQHREMRALGAQNPPAVPGRWPGNVDILLQIAKDMDTGYIGSCSILSEMEEVNANSVCSATLLAIL